MVSCRFKCWSGCTCTEPRTCPRRHAAVCDQEGAAGRRSRCRGAGFVFAPPPHTLQLHCGSHFSPGRWTSLKLVKCTGTSERYSPGERAASWPRAPAPPLTRLYRRPRRCCATAATARPWTGTTTRTSSPWWRDSSTGEPLSWRTSWWRAWRTGRAPSRRGSGSAGSCGSSSRVTTSWASASPSRRTTESGRWSRATGLSTASTGRPARGVSVSSTRLRSGAHSRHEGVRERTWLHL